MNELSHDNEKLLVLQLQNNGVKAFDELFLRYSPRLFRFSLSLLKTEEDAREIVQETFYRIWNKRNEIDSGKSFRSFVFTISYNLIVDQLRLRMKDQEYRKFLYEYFRLEADVIHDMVDFQTVSNRIEQAVEQLPGKRREIFILSREHGLSHREIADRMGITVKTVENQINLALKHIRTHLGNEILPLLLFMSLFVSF